MGMLAVAFVVACIMATAPVSSQKGKPDTSSLNALEKKMDSVMKAIDDKYRQYEIQSDSLHRARYIEALEKANSMLKTIDDKYRHQGIRLDSLHNSKYIESLEKSNAIQSGNNTYFSLLIGFIAICVTVFGVNYFHTARQKRYTALIEENTGAEKKTVDHARSRSADERLERLEKKYESLWKRFELHLSLLEESTSTLKSARSQTTRTPALYIECEGCGKEFDPMKNFKQLRPGRTGKQAILTKCTFCGKKKFLDIPDDRKN